MKNTINQWKATHHTATWSDSYLDTKCGVTSSEELVSHVDFQVKFFTWRRVESDLAQNSLTVYRLASLYKYVRTHVHTRTQKERDTHTDAHIHTSWGIGTPIAVGDDSLSTH